MKQIQSWCLCCCSLPSNQVAASGTISSKIWWIWFWWKWTIFSKSFNLLAAKRIRVENSVCIASQFSEAFKVRTSVRSVCGISSNYAHNCSIQCVKQKSKTTSRGFDSWLIYLCFASNSLSFKVNEGWWLLDRHSHRTLVKLPHKISMIGALSISNRKKNKWRREKTRLMEFRWWSALKHGFDCLLGCVSVVCLNLYGMACGGWFFFK